MSLQLYQVDYKSYLLDFKSLSTEEDDIGRGKLSNTKLLRLHKHNLCLMCTKIYMHTFRSNIATSASNGSSYNGIFRNVCSINYTIGAIACMFFEDKILLHLVLLMVYSMK